MYCCDEHRKYARQEQNRVHFRNYYHNYKETFHEEQRYGLGTGYLSLHKHERFEDELLAIEKEMKKIGIK